jgi:hypothetical protein
LDHRLVAGTIPKNERAELVRNFSSDTVTKLLQIMRDLEDLRGRTNTIQHDFLQLLMTSAFASCTAPSHVASGRSTTMRYPG